MKQYEAMFLFDPTFGANFDQCEAEVQRLMNRAQGEIILCRKWDERRLAYRIQGRKRGMYVLCYFKAPPERIASLERDARLSEPILRVLIVRADEVSDEAMERAFRRVVEEAPAEPAHAFEQPPRRARRSRRRRSDAGRERADADAPSQPAPVAAASPEQDKSEMDQTGRDSSAEG